MYCQLLTACLFLVIAVDLLEAKRALNKHKSRNTHITQDCPDGLPKCSTGECLSEMSYCAGWSRCSNHGVVTTPVECPEVDCSSYNAVACPTSTKCLQRAQICDTYNDCGDSSDEENCSERLCEASEVRCNSGQCFSKAEYCTGPWWQVPPCVDGTDFTGLCLDFTCPEDRFKCHSDGKCIDSVSVCNGHKDCADRSDEADSTCASYQCRADRVKCPTVNMCIRKVSLCDTINDCGDNSDESPEFCNNRECEEDQVRCESGQCLDRDFYCIFTSFSMCNDGSRSPTDPAICGNATI